MEDYAALDRQLSHTLQLRSRPVCGRQAAGSRQSAAGNEQTKGPMRACYLLASGVAVVVCMAAPSSAQSPPVKSDQQLLVEIERRWNEAFYSRDVAFIDTILAEEFVATYDDGTRGDRAKELALAAEFNQQVTSATQDEFIVKVYRDTAVVWFTLHLVGVRQGQSAELILRYTDVFVFRDGRWQCVSTQSTRLNPR